MVSQQKIKEWVDLYLKHVEEITSEVHVNEEEGYKFKAVDIFQTNFDIDAADLSDMLGRSIEQNNLVAGSMYFPRRVLLNFAKEYEKETRQALIVLFNESKEVAERIDETEKKFNGILARWNQEQEHKMEHTFMGLRFLSLLLGFRFPDACNAIKPHEWNTFYQYVDDDFRISQGTSSGERYKILSTYIEVLQTYIKDIPQIKDIHDQLVDGLDFKDKEFRWTTQDVIYVTARVLEKETASIAITAVSEEEQAGTEEEDSEFFTEKDRFAIEEDLQHFVSENFDNLRFGQDLKLFHDNTRRSGLYYPAPGVGEIDVLAVDGSGNYVVIELKRDRASDSAIAQLGRYMQWVEENLAKKDKKEVRGILIAYRGSKSLIDAAKALRFPVQVKFYKLRLDLFDI